MYAVKIDIFCKDSSASSAKTFKIHDEKVLIHLCVFVFYETKIQTEIKTCLSPMYKVV